MSVKPLLINLSNNQEVEITNDRFSVGRSLQADYVLNSMAVSRIHFYIEKKDGIWTIKDHSTNGTLINDCLLKSTSRNLNTGDLIKVRGGSVTLRFSNSPIRFVTTSNAPVTDFIVSTINGDNLPSVSNDHCYERRGPEAEKTPPEGGFVVSPVPPASAPNTASPPNTSSSPNLKRDRSPEAEESTKKCKLDEETTNNRDNFKEELECSICQELFIKAVTLNCSHTFCNMCILKWKTQRNYCPICREAIKTLSPTIVLDNIIEKLISGMNKEARTEREEVVTERSKEKIESTAPISDTCLRMWNTLVTYNTGYNPSERTLPILNMLFDDLGVPIPLEMIGTSSRRTSDSPPMLVEDSDEEDTSDGEEFEEDENIANEMMDAILAMEDDESDEDYLFEDE